MEEEQPTHAQDQQTPLPTDEMADRNDDQYKYVNMSNLVLQADKRFVSHRKGEENGDPESLAGRLSMREMGARTARDAAPARPTTQDPARKRKRTEPAQKSRKAGLLTQEDLDIEGLRYRPRTAATKDVYDLIATEVGRKMGGDYGLAVTASATDAILEYLKDDATKDLDKKREIDDILGVKLTNQEMNTLVNLGKKITDYDAEDEEDEAAAGGDDLELNEKDGVAVAFEDEDDDREDDNTFELRDEDEESEDDFQLGTEEAEDEADDLAPADAEDDADDDDLVLETKPQQSNKERDRDIVPAREIDAFWLQREIGGSYPDATTQTEKAKEAEQIMSALEDESGDPKPLREVENELMELFDYEHPELVGKLVKNRDKIIWVLKLQRVGDDQQARLAIEKEMQSAGHAAILRELQGLSISEKKPKMKVNVDPMDLDDKAPAEGEQEKTKSGLVGGLQPRRTLNVDDLKFDQGSHLMTNQNVKLPTGSTRKSYKGYEEIHVPAPKPKFDPSERLKPTSELPAWAQPGFGSSKSLNRIQTRCYPSAFEGDGNMLICAPTGSGKTNVAMLTMLREIGKHRNPETGDIDLDSFKIVYIAPLKALVQEQVGNFGKRLEPYGITVAELTGDRQLTKQQIADTQVIVTTPEKWDVITRKATDASYTNLVRLICIDEIHLLHDERGPVLENIVARTIRRTEQTGDPVRIVGLSATLPNYVDVAAFVRADPQTGVFHFDGTFRPCPLQQEFVGVTDKKAIKQLKIMNDVCYTKTLQQVGENKQQMLIFVHSRKETAKTAKYIRDKALELETLSQILRTDGATREILKEEAESAVNADLKDVLPYGFGIHHAGMTREDRTTVEDLFSDGHIQVLVCTATLAWGVNLPAHTVIIKGTQIYSPEKGSWVELSPQDTLQMLGRAGRPQYDTYGEGIIITTQSELQYYLSLMNQQLPIESQLASRLADSINAEVVLGNVRTRDEGVEWLGYTYLFVRMLKEPTLYQVGEEYDDDEALEQRRVDLIHSAAMMLEAAGLVKYDKKTGRLQSTDLGRIASHYYLTHNSMAVYNRNIQEGVSPIELCRIFALSEEFKYIPVRQDEKLEMAKLINRVPIPIAETVEEPSCKINILLQAYVSRLKLEGLALMSDLVYVVQSAGRILRAMFEIALKKGYSEVARDCLKLCKTAEKRMWAVMSPLRQFPECPQEIIKKAERIDVPWSQYFDLDEPRMGELLGQQKWGRQVCNMVSRFPRVKLHAEFKPITPSLLRIELAIEPKFEWDDELHGSSEAWWILVEDCDGEKVLFHDQFILRKDYAIAEDNTHVMDFTVMIDEPMPPVYFVHLISDRWMGAETKLVLNLMNLQMPTKFPSHTPLLELQPLPVTSLKRQDLMDLYPDWTNFNRVQSQTFNHLFQSDESVLVACSTGNGKTVCAEFALLRHWSKQNSGRAVYIAPFQEQIDALHKNWQARLSKLAGGKTIVKLTGDLTPDLKLLAEGDLILATAAQWDMMSRKYQRRANVQDVKLLIADDLHLLGGFGGYIYETVVARTHTMASALETKIRIIGLSVSLADARDIGEFIGATKQTIYNFSPSVRQTPLGLHVQTFTIPHFPSLMLAMTKPAYHAILQHASDKPAMVFVPSRKQVRATAVDLLAACAADDDEDRFLNADPETLAPLLEKVKERSLAVSLSHGIAYYHEGMTAGDKRIVDHLFGQGAVQVILVSRDCIWEIQSTAHLVIVMGTQFFEGREHRYIDYPISDILQMFGKAGRSLEDKQCRGVLMCPAGKREYFTKFLKEALPVESQLPVFFHDAFLTEITNGPVDSMQAAVDWSTYTFYCKRLAANPAFYGLKDTSSDGLSSFLSELVEETLKELADAGMIEVDEDEDTVAPLYGAQIACAYNISFYTMQTLMKSLKRNTKLKAMLQIVTAASEFQEIQIRRHEEPLLKRIYDRVPVKYDEEINYELPDFKAFVLLQAHFSRLQLPADLAKDQELILRKILDVLAASVDVCASEGFLNAINVIEMHQMIVQAMWDRDSPLKQIPHFDTKAIEACNKAGVNDIVEFMDAMDPDENPEYGNLVAAMGLDNSQMADAARFTNERYPNVELNVEVEDEENIVTGQPTTINVTIERELEEDEEPNLTVHAPFFPTEKIEKWWVIVGEEGTKTLYACKGIIVTKSAKAKLQVEFNDAGKKKLTVFLMSADYIGVDQAPTVEVDVAQGEPDEDESMDEE